MHACCCRGPPGIPGPRGPPGPTGTSYHGTGPTGAASNVTGPTGAASNVTGPTGAAGNVTGPTGAASVTGPTGAAGNVTGPTGPSGLIVEGTQNIVSQTGTVSVTPATTGRVFIATPGTPLTIAIPAGSYDGQIIWFTYVAGTNVATLVGTGTTFYTANNVAQPTLDIGGSNNTFRYTLMYSSGALANGWYVV